MNAYTIIATALMLLPVQAAPALLGVRATPTAPEVQQHFAEHIPAGTGLTVHRLTPGTPAAEQLSPGDVLLQADGTALRTPQDLADIVALKQAGNLLQLRLLRNGAPLELSLTLSARPEQPTLSVEQQLSLNRLLLLLVPMGDSVIDVPAVRRQLLSLSANGLAQKDDYATCSLYLRHEQYMITITSTERSLTIISTHPEVPDVCLRANDYRRDTERLPEKLEQLLLNAEYYRP